MAKKIGEIELSLQKDALEGWEETYNSLNVKLLNEARQLGHILPRVDVMKENGLYRIVFGRALDLKNYGGHSRAIVALQRGEVLRCNIYDGHRDEPNLSKTLIVYRPIETLKPREDLGWRALERIKDNLDFLPKDIVKWFMRENGLVIISGVLMTQENCDNPPPF